EAPLDFGVFLPLGALGLGLAAWSIWRRSIPAALLLIWWAAPAGLAVLRPTDFPGGDTFFPRRLWQFASQPLALLAAYGLVAGILRPLRVRGAPLALVLLVVGGLAGLPNSWGTWQRIGQFWNGASFADADWDLGGNFRYATWLAQQARTEGPRTIMVPTP